MVSKHDVLTEIPEGHENRVHSTDIAAWIDEKYDLDEDEETKSTNVRDTIQELREEGFPIGGGQGLGGYWIIQSQDELQLVLENIESNIETQEERKQLILEAFDSPPVSYGEPEAPEPDIPQSLRDAVDALVDDRGVGGAERALQSRLRTHEKTDRALAGLSYLRTHHSRGQVEGTAGP